MSQPTSNIDNLLSRIEYIYDCKHCESKKTHYARPFSKKNQPPVKENNNDKVIIPTKKLSKVKLNQ